MAQAWARFWNYKLAPASPPMPQPPPPEHQDRLTSCTQNTAVGHRRRVWSESKVYVLVHISAESDCCVTGARHKQSCFPHYWKTQGFPAWLHQEHRFGASVHSNALTAVKVGQTGRLCQGKDMYRWWRWPEGRWSKGWPEESRRIASRWPPRCSDRWWSSGHLEERTHAGETQEGTLINVQTRNVIVPCPFFNKCACRSLNHMTSAGTHEVAPHWSSAEML